MTNVPGAIAGARVVGERFARSRQQRDPKNPEARIPLLDHIRELRNRVATRKSNPPTVYRCLLDWARPSGLGVVGRVQDAGGRVVVCHNPGQRVHCL